MTGYRGLANRDVKSRVRDVNLRRLEITVDGLAPLRANADPVPAHPCNHQHASAQPHPFSSSACLRTSYSLSRTARIILLRFALLSTLLRTSMSQTRVKATPLAYSAIDYMAISPSGGVLREGIPGRPR